MSNLLVDERDQIFVLNEMLQIDKLCEAPLFAEHSPDLFNMVLEEARKFAVTEFGPIASEADEQGCRFDPDNHSVKAPECYHSPYKLFREGGWIAMCDSLEVGGQGFPLCLGTAVSELFYSSSFCLYGAAELTHGAAKLIEVFGDNKQKELFMTKLYSGEWMGTMCLTESDAGSDLSALKSKAVKKDDGTYAISGTKIFISAGEHDLVENIVHMVLARVEGDPAGPKGISLFVVPKYLVNDDGTLAKRNDVFCAGIEHKMGIHGLSTTTLNFGDNGECTGYLLGKQGGGLMEMFHMMNEQRLLVGLEGLALSSTAYLHAVEYAKTRIQGASVSPKKGQKHTSVPIIEHPDVKRMLLWMKAYVEGCRALAYFASLCIDRTHISDGEDKERWQKLVDLLIPVVKAYNTDMSWEITGTAIQCAGGYGYISDYPFERFARDCKITSLFEGTNGIQAIDLVFRKLAGDKLAAFGELIAKIDKTIEEADKIEPIIEYADTVKKAKDGLVEIVTDMMSQLKDGKVVSVFGKATPFLEVMGDVVLGWMHLWQLSLTYPKLKSLTGTASGEELGKIIDENKEAAFYQGKVLTAQYYIGSILKRSFGKIEQLRSDGFPVDEISMSSFAS
ncbi:MAG: acyl-CoA dehydrogenase [Desulfatiglans sp.]|jgi:alkylation response protein AidB-like acyl-CoA dehydrogenase|nr:acyl-CoA dehydrogenase [Thermodesulfobacteriota bacterium]MEE4354438.1 acyl-CoA dehydrogenase [Desulfatiglans sp.]